MLIALTSYHPTNSSSMTSLSLLASITSSGGRENCSLPGGIVTDADSGAVETDTDGVVTAAVAPRASDVDGTTVAVAVDVARVGDASGACIVDDGASESCDAVDDTLASVRLVETSTIGGKVLEAPAVAEHSSPEQTGIGGGVGSAVGFAVGFAVSSGGGVVSSGGGGVVSSG
jgi:hypothetical protein